MFLLKYVWNYWRIRVMKYKFLNMVEGEMVRVLGEVRDMFNVKRKKMESVEVGK